eukprot:SAG31_NODE_44734_length_261_cov_1.253086_1_plen_72_part_10
MAEGAGDKPLPRVTNRCRGGRRQTVAEGDKPLPRVPSVAEGDCPTGRQPKDEGRRQTPGREDYECECIRVGS